MFTFVALGWANPPTPDTAADTGGRPSPTANRTLPPEVLARLPPLPATPAELTLAEIPAGRPGTTFQDLYAASDIVVRGRTRDCSRDAAPGALYVCTIDVIESYGPGPHANTLLAGSVSGRMPDGGWKDRTDHMELVEDVEFTLFLGPAGSDGVRTPVNPAWGLVGRWDTPDSAGREYGFVYGMRPVWVVDRETQTETAVRWDSWVAALRRNPTVRLAAGVQP